MKLQTSGVLGTSYAIAKLAPKRASMFTKFLFAYDVVNFLLSDVFTVDYKTYLISKHGQKGKNFNTCLENIESIIATYKALKGFKEINNADIQALNLFFESWDAIKFDLDAKYNKNLQAIEKMNELKKELQIDEVIY